MDFVIFALNTHLMKKALKTCLFLLICPILLTAQSGSRSKFFSFDRKAILTLRAFPGDFNPAMEKKVLPKPHPGTDRATVNSVKAKLNKYRNVNKSTTTGLKTSLNADPAVMFRN